MLWFWNINQIFKYGNLCVHIEQPCAVNCDDPQVFQTQYLWIVCFLVIYTPWVKNKFSFLCIIISVMFRIQYFQLMKLIFWLSLCAFKRIKSSTGFLSFPSVHLAVLIQEGDSRCGIFVSFWVKIGQERQPLHMKTCMLSWCVSVIGFHYFKQCALWRRGWVWRNCWKSRRYSRRYSAEICPFTIPWSLRSIDCNRLIY